MTNEDPDLEQIRDELLARIQQAGTSEDMIAAVNAVLEGDNRSAIERLAQRLGAAVSQVPVSGTVAATSDASGAIEIFVSDTAIMSDAAMVAHVDLQAEGEVGRKVATLQEVMAMAVLVTALEPYFAGLGIDSAKSHVLAMGMALLLLFGHRVAGDQ